MFKTFILSFLPFLFFYSYTNKHGRASQQMGPARVRIARSTRIRGQPSACTAFRGSSSW